MDIDLRVAANGLCGDPAGILLQECDCPIISWTTLLSVVFLSERCGIFRPYRFEGPRFMRGKRPEFLSFHILHSPLLSSTLAVPFRENQWREEAVLFFLREGNPILKIFASGQVDCNLFFLPLQNPCFQGELVFGFLSSVRRGLRHPLH